MNSPTSTAMPSTAASTCGGPRPPHEQADSSGRLRQRSNRNPEYQWRPLTPGASPGPSPSRSLLAPHGVDSGVQDTVGGEALVAVAGDVGERAVVVDRIEVD